MKFLLAAILTTISTCGFARENDEVPPGVPADVMSVQDQVPSVPDSINVNNYSTQANVNAAVGQIGTVVGNSVSGIGHAVPVFTGPSIPGASLLNSVNVPRIR
jgi:hypothetical protein